MATTMQRDRRVTALCAGLRMSAEEFLALPESPERYELVDGVVIMSPSPVPIHQRVAREILVQLTLFSEDHGVGEPLQDIDVHIGKGITGGDVVYRPDVIFFRTGRLDPSADRIVGVPDLVVEVISPSSRRFDLETKKNDYEHCGVREYWVVDPHKQSMIFYRLVDERFVEMKPDGDKLPSEAVPGFSLDLARVRNCFRQS